MNCVYVVQQSGKFSLEKSADHSTLNILRYNSLCEAVCFLDYRFTSLPAGFTQNNGCETFLNYLLSKKKKRMDSNKICHHRRFSIDMTTNLKTMLLKTQQFMQRSRSGLPQ